MQASVPGDRRGDQLTAARANKQEGGEQRPKPQQQTKQTHNNTQQAEKDDDHRGAKEGQEGRDDEESRAWSEGADQTTPETASPNPSQQQSKPPTPQPETRDETTSSGRGRQHASSRGSEWGEEKENKLIPTTTRHKRGFWCEPGRDRPAAATVQVRGTWWAVAWCEPDGATHPSAE